MLQNTLLKQRIIIFLFLIVLLLNASEGMITMLSILSIAILIVIPVKKYIDKQSISLLFFSLFYVFIANINGAVIGLSTILVYGLPWFFFYVIGRYVVDQFNEEFSLLKLITYSIIALSLITQISIISKILNTGVLIDSTRSFYYIGTTSDDFINSTTALAMISPSIAGLSSILVVKQNKPLVILLSSIAVITLLGSINTLTRGPIVVCAFVFVIVACIKHRNHPLKLILILSFIFILVFVILHTSGFLDDIISGFASRNEDGSAYTMGNRSQRWAVGINNLYKYPFGWWTETNSWYWIHNMWLDIAKISGIIPFFILLILTIRFFVLNINLIRRFETGTAYLLLSLNLCICVSNFQEPIISGICPGYLCFIWGFSKQYYINKHLGIIK